MSDGGVGIYLVACWVWGHTPKGVLGAGDEGFPVGQLVGRGT